jgi:hypothetical protein
MPRQNVVSREYKVMLRTDRFAGEAGRLLARANEFFAQLAAAAAPITVGTHGEFEAGGKQRTSSSPSSRPLPRRSRSARMASSMQAASSAASGSGTRHRSISTRLATSAASGRN